MAFVGQMKYDASEAEEYFFSESTFPSKRIDAAGPLLLLDRSEDRAPEVTVLFEGNEYEIVQTLHLKDTHGLRLRLSSKILCLLQKKIESEISGRSMKISFRLTKYAESRCKVN